MASELPKKSNPAMFRMTVQSSHNPPPWSQAADEDNDGVPVGTITEKAPDSVYVTVKMPRGGQNVKREDVHALLDELRHGCVDGFNYDIPLNERFEHDTAQDAA